MAQPLPLFPLDTVLFPDMLMPLHIFEPRYRLLVKRSLDGPRPFGIVLSAQPAAIGTEAEIVGHQPFADGRSFIVVRGTRRFALESVDSRAEPYLVGSVRYLDEDDGADASGLATTAADRFGEYLHTILATTDELRSEAPDVAAIGTGTPRQIAYRIASGLAIDPTERQRLLEAATTKDRLASEIHLLERENGLLKELLLRLHASGEGRKLN